MELIILYFSEFERLMKKVILLLIYVLLIKSNVGLCQELNLKDELAKNLMNDPTGEEIKKYMGPLANACGINMASSFIHSAAIKSFPHFDVRINLLSALIPEDAKTYTDNGGQIRPTIFGDKGNEPGISSGFKKNQFLLPVMQLNLGFFSGLDFTLRYTDWNLESMGRLKLIGIGMKYELIQLFSEVAKPVYLSMLAEYQNMNIDEYIESAAFGMNLFISKELPLIPIEFLAGVGYNNNILTVDTNALGQGDSVGSISINGLNGLQYQLGIVYYLLIFNAHFNYNIGIYNSFGVGLGIQL